MNNKIWALMLLGVMATHVNATENGLDTFGLGAEGIAAGALPPAGVYLLNYYQNYHASEFKDGPDNFHADVNVYIPRLVSITPTHCRRSVGFICCTAFGRFAFKCDGHVRL